MKKYLENLENVSADYNNKISDVLSKINKNELGICFILKKGVLKGICTDGDIRRSLLKGYKLNSPVKKILSKKYVCLDYRSSIDLIQKKISDVIKIIPLVDENKKLVDYVSYNRFRSIPQYEPDLKGNELIYLNDCIKTGWISSRGKYVNQFEDKFKNFIRAKYSLSTSSCTTALHLALKTLGIKKGDEVIVPNYTFVSPINSVIHSGAKPVIADIETRNLCMSLNSIKKKITKRTKAIIIVHTYGHAAEIDKITKYAKKNKILLIEDCAEALGTYFKKKHVGIFGDCSCFSFYGNKTISTVEGGMLIFKDKSNFLKAKQLRDHGMSSKTKYWYEQIGFNYRLTNIQAAIGIAQLEKLDIFLNKKQWIAKNYFKNLKDIKHIQLPLIEPKTINSYWLFYFIVKKKYINHRNKIVNYLLKKGIEARSGFFRFDQMKLYKSYSKGSFPNSKFISDTIITLPSFPALKENEIRKICHEIKKYFKTYNGVEKTSKD